MRLKLLTLFCFCILGLFLVGYDRFYTPMPPVLEKAAKTDDLKEKTAIPAPCLPLTPLGKPPIADYCRLAAPTILINFWATWCAPCLQELPSMLNLVKSAKGRIALIAISIDDTPQPIETYIKKLNTQTNGLATSPHVYWVWDGDKTLSLTHFNVIKVPETFVISPHRTIQEKIVGAEDWMAPNILKKFNKN